MTISATTTGHRRPANWTVSATKQAVITATSARVTGMFWPRSTTTRATATARHSTTLTSRLRPPENRTAVALTGRRPESAASFHSVASGSLRRRYIARTTGSTPIQNSTRQLLCGTTHA